MSDKAVCRTAPAKPDLFNIYRTAGTGWNEILHLQRKLKTVLFGSGREELS